MKIMRLRHAKLIVVLIVIANLILFYYSWKSTLWKNIAASLTLPSLETYDLLKKPSQAHVEKSPKEKARNAFKHIRKSITIVFRTFYTFENDIKDSIDSILDVIPNMPIVVYLEGIPYPPLVYQRNNTAGGQETSVRFVNLGFDLVKPVHELNPLSAVHTKYALFMPDSVRLSSKNLLQKILREINTNSWENKDAKAVLKSKSMIAPEEVVRRVIIVPFAGNLKSFVGCIQITLDLPNWTIQYTAVNSTSDKCDLFLQKHALLVDVGVLKEMPEPLAAPFPEMFYIQAKLSNITKFVFPTSFQDGRRLFAAYHTKQRRTDIRRRQFREMYKKLQIKRIVRRSHKVSIKSDSKDSSSYNAQHNLVLDTQFSSSNFSLPQVTDIDLIGCERTTKSCVGTVYNQRPFYVYLGKHTPPCCLDKLKSTFNHVLEEFENVGIRYWLDNQALRTAIDTNRLSPDAYDIDISFNVNDLERSNSLKKSQNKPYVDNEGFYWIKATDGHYFKVQFSKINQIGVNLLPFEISGNVVKPNGFFGWKAKPFSADFLHPMSTVLFLGKNIMCPNNVRDYLEFKSIP
ncbi:ribitol 5-phosphate transferase FKRP-like [Musca domestica]|uniref:Ribitol 5-phosphate transferase FKRP-like n=1 Tax=Musca domestica TaxID=7370 RepID=A0ABM3USS3_MUSDO|nr:ribitol 5-phosphate transferase FKRP-like [Musca domestica]